MLCLARSLAVFVFLARRRVITETGVVSSTVCLHRVTWQAAQLINIILKNIFVRFDRLEMPRLSVDWECRMSFDALPFPSPFEYIHGLFSIFLVLVASVLLDG